MRIPNKTEKADLAQRLSAGTQKHLSNVAQVTFAGSTATPAQVQAQLELIATLRADVEAAKATLKVKVAAEKARVPALHAYESAYVAFIKATFGNQADVLADFGLAPKKVPTPLTVEQMAAAQAKREATREARGTMGSKQKAKVKGDVTGVTIRPVTATPAAAAHSASPVATTPAANPAAVPVIATATTPSHGA